MQSTWYRPWLNKRTLLYLVVQDGLLKIGIGYEGGKRLQEHACYGWDTYRTWPFEDRAGALRVEQGIVRWWRVNGWKQAVDRMPQGGATETVSQIDVTPERVANRIDNVLACRMPGRTY